MSKFPQSPSFTGFNTPSRIEADIADLVVEGDIPPALEGAFYRVQPDPQFPPLLGDDIAFNGDGMITMFHFEKRKGQLSPALGAYRQMEVGARGGPGPVRRLSQSADRRSFGRRGGFAARPTPTPSFMAASSMR